MGRKVRTVTLFRRNLSPPSNTMSHGPRPASLPSGILIHPAVWPQQTWAKMGVVPFGGTGAWSPSKTMCPWPRPTSMASLILIRQTVWPQHTIVTDGQTRQTDNGPIAYKRSPRNRRNDTKCSVLIWLCRLFAAGATGRSHAAFGRPFVKRFALCYPISVCRSVMSCLSSL